MCVWRRSRWASLRVITMASGCDTQSVAPYQIEDRTPETAAKTSYGFCCSHLPLSDHAHCGLPNPSRRMTFDSTFKLRPSDDSRTLLILEYDPITLRRWPLFRVANFGVQSVLKVDSIDANTFRNVYDSHWTFQDWWISFGVKSDAQSDAHLLPCFPRRL
jgi:hypothetical protein